MSDPSSPWWDGLADDEIADTRSREIAEERGQLDPSWTDQDFPGDDV